MGLTGFMYDTNIFNHLVEDKILYDQLPQELPIYLTHVQFDEIQNCSDEEKKSRMLSWAFTLREHDIPTESGVYGISKYGRCKYSNGPFYKKIFRYLNSKKRRKNYSNHYDALVGETAILNDLLLFTNDNNLFYIVNKLGGWAKKIEFDLDKTQQDKKQD